MATESLLRSLLEKHGEDSEAIFAEVAALGPGAIDVIVPSLSDPDGLIRAIAARFLGDLGDRRAVPHLIRALDAEGLAAQALWAEERTTKDGTRETRLLSGPVLLFKQIAHLFRPRGGGGRNRLVASSSYSLVRMHCAAALGELGDPSAIPALTALLDDDYPQIRDAARQALSRIPSPAEK